ncbi:MAG: hypothetical protein LBL20_01680 [Treponema sp.]|jgi:hypothetical protein|nr:hypothetical protein [Treponema sp.]
MEKSKLVILKLLFGIAVAFMALLALSCSAGASNNIERVPVTMSDIFTIGNKAMSGSNHGWLAPEEQLDGRVLWVKQTGNQETDEHYDGVRLFNIDRDMSVRGGAFDAGPYDGVVFKYRTNVYNTTFRFRDFSFWFEWGSDTAFGAHDYENGWENPSGDYQEVVIPFFKLWRWGIQQNTGAVDNDLINFDPNQLSNIHIDGRNTIPKNDGQYEGIWLEIVDFDFFIYR